MVACSASCAGERGSPQRAVSRAGDRHPADLPQPPRHARRVLQMANAHRDIQPFVDQIEIAIVQHHFDLHLRVVIEKRHHHRRHVAAAELHRRSNAQQAAQLRFGGILHHRLIILQQLLRALQQPHARFGRRQPPGGALHQPGAEPLFQRGDGR